MPDKNIRLLNGKPLLAHSIEHALQSQMIDRVIVSTDSPRYAEIARQYGAETPFLRPAAISQDSSTDLDVFQHALAWLAEHENYVPEICVHLRPTYPIRKIDDIDAIIRILLGNSELDSVRSVAPSPETPFKMWFRDENGLLSPVVQTNISDAHSLPRQILPPTFLQNASVDAIRSEVILRRGSMTGERIFGYVMEENYDIDTEPQFAAVSAVMEPGGPVEPGEEKRTFCFDIDGVIATLSPGNQYDLAGPCHQMVAAINALYDRGHRILLFTARGSASGINWVQVTRGQMAEWGVKYHQLLFGKPAADYYIDDKMLPVEQVFELAGNQSPRQGALDE